MKSFIMAGPLLALASVAIAAEPEDLRARGEWHRALAVCLSKSHSSDEIVTGTMEAECQRFADVAAEGLWALPAISDHAEASSFDHPEGMPQSVRRPLDHREGY